MPKKVGCTEELAKQIRDLHAQGISIRKISKLVKRNRDIVSHVLRGNYKVKDELEDGVPVTRSAHGIECECRVRVLELFKMPDGRYLCLACSLRSGQLREGMIPLKKIPLLPNHDTSWPVDDYVIPVEDDSDFWTFK